MSASRWSIARIARACVLMMPTHRTDVAIQGGISTKPMQVLSSGERRMAMTAFKRPERAMMVWASSLSQAQEMMRLRRKRWESVFCFMER